MVKIRLRINLAISACAPARRKTFDQYSGSPTPPKSFQCHNRPPGVATVRGVHRVGKRYSALISVTLGVSSCVVWEGNEPFSRDSWCSVMFCHSPPQPRCLPFFGIRGLAVDRKCMRPVRDCRVFLSEVIEPYGGRQHEPAAAKGVKYKGSSKLGDECSW